MFYFFFDSENARKRSTKQSTNYCREIRNNYCVIDTETTGTSIYYDEVIELGALKIRNGEIVDKFQTLVKPNMSIPKEATAVNHITDEMVKDAPSISGVINPFLEFIGSDLLVGQNTSFDINIICNNADCEIDNKYVCIEQMVKKLWIIKDYKLDTVRDYFDIDTEAHRALGDCEATNTIYSKIKDELIRRNASIDDFYAKKNKGLKVSEIEINENEFDIDSPIYERSFAFTGTLPFSRDNIIEQVMKIGGICHSKGAITKDTEFLVIGADFYKKWRESGEYPSDKIRKAIENNIEILDSNTFMDMLNYKD